jgi:cytochrome c oxidase subunit 4
MSQDKEIKENHAEDIQHHIKVYVNVFIALAILTVITVAVSFLDVSFIEAFFIAITVATIKGSLVLSFFMHLLEEKPAVIWILATTMVAFLILMFIPLISLTDQANAW